MSETQRELSFEARAEVEGRKPILLSPPDVGERERELLLDAFDSNWIAPEGPHVHAFEDEFAKLVGVPAAAALSSGTAALHLALHLLGVGQGADVIVSTFTFAGSVFPIRYVGARPVFVDSEPHSWNLDPDLLEEELERRSRSGNLPAAVIAVHLYGQAADLERVRSACQRFEVPLVEDAAEALGATHRLGTPGTLGRVGIFSFNGNKIVTTSGGGMLVSHDAELVLKARKLSAQAREPVPHYEHLEVGFNYRLSNLLAAVGRAQIEGLAEKVRSRRRTFDYYRGEVSRVEGVTFQPEASWGRHSRWLTCLTLSPQLAPGGPEPVRERLRRHQVEVRQLWKPMHLQPVFHGCPVLGGMVSERLFREGLCLPSGSGLTDEDRARVVETLLEAIA